MLCLSLCHTILIQKKDDQLIYNASSPDELALVNFARFCGYKFLGIDEQNYMEIQTPSKQIVKYQLLHVLEFNSTRKRQSVIIKDPQQKIILYTKGADSIIEKRFSPNIDQQIWKKTQDHLTKFSNQGLRTLLLAKRDISQQEFDEWNKKYTEAITSINDRDQKCENCQELIEIDLELLGATAIEDKLQDEVGPTISSLKQAEIKVWVLTGDKIETAINIGFSCQLLTQNQDQIIIDGITEQDVYTALQRGKEKTSQSIRDHALIISGDALIHGIKDEYSKIIIEIAEKCSVVIACRVSPKQKQEVVSLVRKEKPKVITLAIGDGANDVNMITAAHVGNTQIINIYYVLYLQICLILFIFVILL